MPCHVQCRVGDTATLTPNADAKPDLERALSLLMGQDDIVALETSYEARLVASYKAVGAPLPLAYIVQEALPGSLGPSATPGAAH